MNKPGYCSTCKRLSTLKDGRCSKCRNPVKGKNSPVVQELVKKAISGKRKTTGEKKMFDEIASERPHVCFITHTPIRNVTPWNCAHVLPKSRAEAFRLNKENLILVQDWVHEIIDKGDIAKLHKYPGFTDYLALKERLHCEYGKLSITQRKELIQASRAKYGVK